MSSVDMAPPVDQEAGASPAVIQEPEEELDLNVSTFGGAESGFILEDWSGALQKFIAGRNGEVNSPKTPTLGRETESVFVEASGGGSVEGESMEETEPVGSEGGEVAAVVVAEPAAAWKSEIESMSKAAADITQVKPAVEEAGDGGAPSGDAPSSDLEVEALEVEEAAPPAGDVEEKGVDVVESGDDVVWASESGENGDLGAGEESAENGDGEAVEEASNAEPDVEAAGVDSVGTPSEVEEEKGVEANPEEPASEVSGEVSVEESSSEKVDSEAPVEDVPVVSALTEDVEEKGLEVNSEEPAIEVPVEESSSEKVDSEAPIEDVSVVAAPTEDVEEKGLEVNSEEAAEVSGEAPVEESPKKVDSEAVNTPAEEVVAEAEPNGELSQVEAVPAPTDDVEEKAVEVKSRDGVEVSEEASPEVPAEESLDNVDSGAIDAPVEEIADVVDAATSVEPEEEPASQEEANPKTSEEEPAEGTDASVETVGRSVAEESIEKAKRSEVVDAHVEGVATSGAIEDKAVEVDAEDLNEGGNEEASPETPGEAFDASVEEVVAPTDGEPGVELANLESVPVPSDNVEAKAIEVNSEEASQVATPDEIDTETRDAHVDEVVEEASPASIAEPNEEVAELEAVSVPSDDVEEKSIEMKSGDDLEGSNVEESSPASEKVDSEAIDAPVEGTGDKVEDAATSVEPDVQSISEEVEPQMLAPETEELSTTMATSTPSPAEEELFDLPDNSQGPPTEDVPSEREAETVSAEDRSSQVEELLQESEADPQTQSVSTGTGVNEGEVAETLDAQSVTAKEGTEEVLSVPIEHTSEEPSEALAEPCDKDPLTEELEHPTASAASIPSIIGSAAKELPNTDVSVANGTIKTDVDVSHLLQTVLTDEEAKTAAAIHYPDEAVEAGTHVLESEAVHEESEASGAFQEKEVKTVAREFNLNDMSEAPITSEVVVPSGDDLASHVVTPYLASALAAASSESEEGAPKSYSLDEVATHLHDAAAQALQDAEATDDGEKHSSVAKAVAQIGLEESSNAKDSSEYISEVVQHVAQFAQDAGQSDPNVLPDTVARVFDGETTASPANQVTQPKETTSLGTMVSLFVIWCVSLCASHVSSKDMPAPALKLAAEEVTAVLHSNAPSQPIPAQGTATSSH